MNEQEFRYQARRLVNAAGPYDTEHGGDPCMYCEDGNGPKGFHYHPHSVNCPWALVAGDLGLAVEPAPSEVLHRQPR